MALSTVPRMAKADGRKPPRSTQKFFTFGAARTPFELWCESNGYDQNLVVLSGWLALHAMDHKERATWFAAVKQATAQEFLDLPQLLESVKAANAAAGRVRPADSTGSVASRASSRAG